MSDISPVLAGTLSDTPGRTIVRSDSTLYLVARYLWLSDANFRAVRSSASGDNARAIKSPSERLAK